MTKTLSPTEQIYNLAREKLEVFEASIRDDGTYKDSIYKGAQSASQQIASDYGSRFLVELIQNAYDAHQPDREDGKIKALLVKEEDKHGALYVANRGHVFSWKDVESLCSIGTSNKPVGQSIGNKGLGFRSVRYVTDDPHIYSKPDNRFSESYNGYCFRFARGNDFDELLEERSHRELAKKDMPSFHIPIPLSDQDPIVRSFAHEGYSTVIRLPLRSESSYQSVIKLFEEIQSQNVPLLLFLRRIDTLEMVVDRDPEKSFSLSRETKPLILDPLSHGDDKYSCVNLGSGEKYFVAWHMIPETEVKNAISKSVELGQLHPSWEDWEGNGELAVAVKLNGDVISPRLYTYLPMGDQAESPFYGYLHGSFYPKADRTSLDASIPVNALYIDEAARLCASTILTLRKTSGTVSGILSQEEREIAIVDLLTWTQSQGIEREGAPAPPILMRNAFLELGTEFSESDILPIVPRGGKGSWGTPKESWRWDHQDLKIFGSYSLAGITNAAILSPKLGQDRLSRLEDFIINGDDNLSVDPTDAELSRIAEIVAASVITPKSSKRAKMDYYLELESIFKNKTIDLSERKILYCTDGMLRPSTLTELEEIDMVKVIKTTKSKTKRKRRRRTRLNTTTVFSPSSRSIDVAKNSDQDDHIPQVPTEFEKNLAFLNDELDWYGELEKVRVFFEDRKLVRRYDADALIVHVSTLSQSNHTNRVRQAALLWVFNLWSIYQKAQRSLSLRGANLLVPTLSHTWVEANQAIFSAGWPTNTLGNIAEEFLMETSSYGAELLQMQKQLLAHKTAKPFLSKDAEPWSVFLEAIGVKYGIQPSQIEDKGFEIYGRNINVENVSQQLQMDDVTRQYWQDAIREHIATVGKTSIYRSSMYELDGSFWHFPGQEQYSNFSEQAKLRYAQLILRWLNGGTSRYLEVTLFSRVARYASRLTWPTPFGAFIRQAPWLPVEIQNGLNSELRFLPPSEVWLPNEDDNYLPPYLPGIPRVVRREILIGSTSKALVGLCKANILNDPASLPNQVWYLGKYFADARVDSYHLGEFLNLYNNTWIRLASSGATIKTIDFAERQFLIMKRNNEFISIDIKAHEDIVLDDEPAEQEKIYVRDTEDNLGIELATKQGFYIFDTGMKSAREVASLIRSLLGERFRAVSELPISLIVDGEEYVPNSIEEDFAVTACPWLPYVVYLSMESLSGTAAQHLPADRSAVINRVNNIRIHLARSIHYKVENRLIPLSDNKYGAVAFDNINKPLLIIQSDTDNLDWDALANASSQFSQLLRQVDLELAIKHCLRTLQRLQEPIAGPITDRTRAIEALCSEFGLNNKHAEKALEGLGNSIVRLGRLLRPIIHYLKGIDDSRQFTTLADQARTVPDLVEALKVYLDGTTFSTEVVVNTCQRALNVGFIRDELGFSFGDFNRSLIAVGDDPDIYPDSHVAAVRSFIAEHKDAIMACLRTRFMEQFKRVQPLHDYVRCRAELDTLQPKEEWFIDFLIPEEHLIQEMINQWLAQNGAPSMSEEQNLALTWSKVRVDNKLRVKRFVQSHANTVKAWCYKQKLEPPLEWNGSSIPDNLSNILHDLGTLDFELLDESNLISWLMVANIWPKGMPQTTIIEELGLEEKDLTAESSHERAVKLQREKEVRSIVFNGRQIDPQEVDPEKLAEEVYQNLSRSVTKVTLANMANLRQLSGEDPGPKPHSQGGKGGSGGNRNIPQEKTDLIGFLGECAVYYWLTKLLPRQDIDSAWMSRYRERLLPGAGDDSLGHDFKIMYHSQSLYLEVKSSLGDPQEFELGETEVRRARDCATTRGTKYRIVYVSNVHDSRAMKLDVLPNPLSDEGRLLFRIGGQGIRYKFQRGT